jgi:hypothetical protein
MAQENTHGLAFENLEPKPENRKPYIKPEIIHEQNLETRAGSPLQVLPGLDPLNPGG